MKTSKDVGNDKGLSRGNRGVWPPAGAARATTSTRPDDGLAGPIGRRRSSAMFAARGFGMSATVNGSSAPSSSPGHWQVAPLGRTSVGPVTPAEAGACYTACHTACYTAITRNWFAGHNALYRHPNMCNCRTASNNAGGWHQNQTDPWERHRPCPRSPWATRNSIAETTKRVRILETAGHGLPAGGHVGNVGSNKKGRAASPTSLIRRRENEHYHGQTFQFPDREGT